MVLLARRASKYIATRWRDMTKGKNWRWKNEGGMENHFVKIYKYIRGVQKEKANGFVPNDKYGRQTLALQIDQTNDGF